MKQFKEHDLEEIINKQFLINNINCSYKEIKDNPIIEWKKWFQYYITTQDKEDIFKVWLKDYLRPFVWSQKRIKKEVDWVILGYGLMIKE